MCIAGLGGTRGAEAGAADRRVRAPSLRVAFTTAFFFLCAVIGSPAPVAAGTEVAPASAGALPATTTNPRPRIGLALGGGGAKGAAHVGVLTMLEDMRIPIDCIVGTSMGALVGGTYAAGMTAAEVEQAIRAISWSQTIGFEGWRQKLPMRRKLAGRTYSNNFEFGFRDGSVAAPSGIINTQNVEQTIRYLVARSLGTNDFDRLPIPFRAIATDMMTGEMVVLAEGDLAQSMRASMAVPGVFSPVTIDGRTLGDGGLTRNVPVDIARETCADVVIAVAVPTPAPPPEALQSPITMISRTLDVLIGANERQQLESLGPQDVSIVVPMGEIGSGSFDKVSEAIPLGRRAAEAQRDSLRRYSLPAAEYRAWREAARRPDSRRVELGDVKVVGLQRVEPGYVESHLGLEPGQSVDQRQLANAVNDVFSLGDFDGVQYALVGDPDRPDLRVEATEKALGPNILRFDLGVAVGTAGGNAFVLAADYLRPWINARGGEVHGLVQFGRTSLIDLSLYQPLDALHRWFVEPGARASRSTEDLYVDDETATRYNFDGAYAYLDTGRVFGTSAELRLGLRNGSQRATRDIAFPGLPTLPTEAYGGVFASFTYDDRDREALATNGWLHRLRYYRGMDELGSRREYDRLEGLLMHSWPTGDNLVTARVAGGANFQGELPFYDLFTLGGPISFPGLGLGQLRGTSYWTTAASYLYKVADMSPLFGHSYYAGGSLIAGDMSGRIDDVREPTTLGAALLFGGRTPLGPLTMSLSTTSTQEWSVLVTLGRPIEERTITDPTW